MSKFIPYKIVLAGFLLSSFLVQGENLAGQTTAIGFSISGATITEKDTFTVSLNADSLLTGRSVYGYRFYLTYSPTYFEFVEVEGIGSVLTSWGTPTFNSSNEGTLIMAGAGTAPLAGSGNMIYLKFISKRSGSAYISFNTSESYLNERNPSTVFTNGYIQAAARSYPNISPDSRQLFIGEEVQMSVSGGVAPYVYSVENPLVAIISNENTVKAIGPGTTKVFVTDANGEVSYITGLFDVRAIKMELEEVSTWPADTFYIPLKVEIAPGNTIFSGKFDLTFDNGLSGLPGDILPGDFPLVMESNATGSRVKVSFASSSGVTGNGILCYVAFRANTSGSRQIQFENMQFNESLLAYATKSAYYITVNSLPLLSFSPVSGTLMWGKTIKINVSNGTAPYIYSVSDPSIASIDAQGNLAAISGGQITVSATDAHGAVKTSGVFTITDNKITIQPTDGVLDSETRVPIISSALPEGKVIYGFKSSINFDASHLDFIKVDPPNGGTLIQSTLDGNTIHIAGASGDGISSGVIGFLVFKIKNTLPLDGRADVTFVNFSGNENSLYSQMENGNVHRVEQVSYRPIANAGQDFSIQEGKTGYLDGSGSYDNDGDPLNYIWRAPDGFVLSDSTIPSPQFSAPFVSENTSYTITLIVNDGTNESDPSEVKVMVLQINHPPVADAGEDLNFVEGSSVSLDGSSSYDPDSDAISFKWTSLDGIVLFNSTSHNPSFILPQVTVNTDYRFTLVVNDAAVNSQPDTVIITAIQVNKKPVAFAGGDFNLNENEPGTLDGSLSYDDENASLSYFWTAPPEVTLSSNTIAKPEFTAPAVHRDSVLVFTLIVNDGTRNSEPDEVQVTILNIDILNSETLIDSVMMTGLDSFDIDTTNALVKLFVPYGSDIRSLSPDFRISPMASVNPAGGSLHDFSTPVYYSVTAEDGISSKLWKVEIISPERIISRQLNSGWNWISLNVQPADMSISNLFNNLTLTDLDYVKSVEYSATYYNETGWFGNLFSFPQNQMVKFRINTAGNLNIQGMEINPAIIPLPLAPGWNNIAYLLRSDAAINSAIETSSIPSGDVLLKGLSGSSIYYSGSGWAGELDTLRVFYGYKINVQSAGNLYYNTSVVTPKSLVTEKFSRKQLLQNYKLYPENFEFSSTLIAEVINNEGQNSLHAGDLILAYSRDECRGVSEARYIPALDKYIFILSYYSNNEEEDITFKIKPYSNDLSYSSDFQVKFHPDDITGKAYQPLQIALDIVNSKTVGLNENKICIYPNPVIEQLTITATETIKKITLYDLTGKEIVHFKPEGKSFTLSMQDLVSGIYTIKIETINEVIIRKVIRASN
jgi:hypothetical protein